MRKRMIAALGTALLSAAPAAGAQVFTPTFQAPVPGQDLGVYLFDSSSDVGVEGIYRLGFGQGDLGLRVGFADTDGDGVILLGADYRNPLRVASVQPLALAFTAGAQAALGDADGFGVQGGLSIGYTFSEVRMTPYIHPRLTLTSIGDDSELDVNADLGFDLDVARNLRLRLGVNVGDGADWGIGLAFRR
jgi:hypothetical protein